MERIVDDVFRATQFDDLAQIHHRQHIRHVPDDQPAAAAGDSTTANNLPPTSAGVDIDGDGKADFSVSHALNVYSERLSLDDSLSLDHEELEVRNHSRVPHSTNAKPSPGLDQEKGI